MKTQYRANFIDEGNCEIAEYSFLAHSFENAMETAIRLYRGDAHRGHHMSEVETIEIKREF